MKKQFFPYEFTKKKNIRFDASGQFLRLFLSALPCKPSEIVLATQGRKERTPSDRDLRGKAREDEVDPERHRPGLVHDLRTRR